MTTSQVLLTLEAVTMNLNMPFIRSQMEHLGAGGE